MPGFAMINEVDILKHSQGGDFCGCSGKKPVGLLRVISCHHELVVKLGEEVFNPFPELFVSLCRRCPFLSTRFPANFLNMSSVFIELCDKVVHMRNDSNQ